MAQIRTNEEGIREGVVEEGEGGDQEGPRGRVKSGYHPGGSVGENAHPF